MYRLATKRTAKTSRRKREREFFSDTDNDTCIGLQRITYCWEEKLNRRRGLRSSHLSWFTFRVSS